MLLNPRYGADPVLTLDGPPDAVLAPAVRQRRRLADHLARFDEADWAHPSRCEGWSNRDVIVHLDSTNAFWSASITGGLGGEPTRWLARFDPGDSPAEHVAAAGDRTIAEVLDRFLASNEAFLERLHTLDASDCIATAEAPPGHLTVSAVVHHALWDGWVHERDVLVPLGARPAEVEDEVAACVRYAAGLGPALAVNRGRAGTGSLGAEVTAPDLSVRVEVTDHVAVRSGGGEVDVTLTGDGVTLVEQLSGRAPLDHEVPRTHAWLIGVAAADEADPGA